MNKERMFQFHMVRLKVIPDEGYFTEALFQFHMVRLKGSSNVIVQKLRQVSIPHGTIKSECGSDNIRCIRVSIPHGTIKSNSFIMIFIVTKIVSIPQGTIKSGIHIMVSLSCSL